MGILSKRSEGTIVGLYGKHTTTREFLRLNAGGTEVRCLDEWLTGALASAQSMISNWERAYNVATPVYFITSQDPKSRRCLVGVLVPSRDSSGREYPLVVFAEMDAALLLGHYTVVPHLRFLMDVERLLGRRRRLDHERLAAAVAALPPPDDDSLQLARQECERFWNGNTCEATFSTMFNPGQEAVALKTLEEICRSLRADQPLPRYGIRCPVGGFPAGEVSLWLALTRRALPLQIVPSAMWTRNTLLIYFSKLSSKVLTALWQIGWYDDSMCDLASASLEGQAPNPINPTQPLSALFS